MANSPQPSWLDPKMWVMPDGSEVTTIEFFDEESALDLPPEELPQPDMICDASPTEEIRPEDEEPDDKKP